jgi:threonine/homoserine/homoserine lactone efflux protein
MAIEALAGFLGASIALTVAPGPDNVFVLTQGITRGRRAAVITAWGMCSGITVHTLAAAAGASALFYSSALAFQCVKWAGAAYLLYLAFRAVRERQDPAGGVDRRALPAHAHFRRGFLMNLLNPKVALFFLAFLPQFTARGGMNVAIQMALLGALFMLQATVVFTLIGFFSGSLGHCLARNPSVSRWLSWVSAAVFASLALRLALQHR